MHWQQIPVLRPAKEGRLASPEKTKALSRRWTPPRTRKCLPDPGIRSLGNSATQGSPRPAEGPKTGKLQAAPLFSLCREAGLTLKAVSLLSLLRPLLCDGMPGCPGFRTYHGSLQLFRYEGREGRRNQRKQRQTCTECSGSGGLLLLLGSCAARAISPWPRTSAALFSNT